MPSRERQGLLDLPIVNGGNWYGGEMRLGLYLNSRSPRGGIVGGGHGILGMWSLAGGSSVWGWVFRVYNLTLLLVHCLCFL